MELEKLVTTYLDSNPIIRDNDRVKEFEIRFGTIHNNARKITQIDYDNVAKHLLACGFHIQSENHMLRITNEYIDRNTGEKFMSRNVRCEIDGESIIKQYCRTNSIQSVLDSGSAQQVKFVQKGAYRGEDGNPVRYANVPDYNMRASFQTETNLRVTSGMVQNIIRTWSDSKKGFRLINRTRFVHPIYPLFADISMVKTSAKKGRDYIPAYTMEDAGVFKRSPGYEIEIEVDNNRVGSGTPFADTKTLVAAMKKIIRVIIGGMQQTKYPISYTEHDKVLENYMKIAHKEVKDPETRHFIGPGSTTLQIENIVEKNNANVPNIRTNYCVTDKADGERRLLMINKDGRIYMISTNMRTIFTGAITNNSKLFNSILDGEYIRTKSDTYIFAAFDLYFVNGDDKRSLPFIHTDPENTNTRLAFMQYFVDSLRPLSVLIDKNKNRPSPIQITTKTFVATDENVSIFACCAKILSNVKDGLYNYETDGLIFTPSLLPVGANKQDDPPSRMKRTWEHSFKWKPPQFNTIDFLVTSKKDDVGKNEIHHQYQDGVNVSDQTLLKYKTMILRCGYDEARHGIANPCETVLRGEAHITPRLDGRNYKPMPFIPTTPYQENAYICNVAVNERDDMLTLEGEAFDNNTIVEFQYDLSKPNGWNWVPLRVRHDKTAELHNTGRNFGNAYHVANANWKSIHNPVTDDMLTTGQNIPDESVSSDIYYNNVSITESKTRNLRNFHNLIVKKRLIQGALSEGGTLIDYSVGKAGDLPKWLYAKAKFVYGIDLSPDNIHNKIDGTCIRYIKEARKSNKIFDAVFSVGNTSENIVTGEAFDNDKDKSVNDAIFGKGAREGLGKGVASVYGIAAKGFDVGSCQFSLHYFFKNKKTLHSFVRNLAETIKVNGRFIGTCYDGNEVFRMLASHQSGESVSLYRKGTKIFEIMKRYSETGFPNDESSLEYAIDVFQETINQYFREYLVNFAYFSEVMEDYGFTVISDEEATSLNLPRGSGLFSLLADESNIPGSAARMSKEEKQISFLNRFFVFKKVRDVDASIVMKNALVVEDPEIVVRTDEDIIDEVYAPRKTDKKTLIE